jgi:hypothetical protein
MSNGAGHAEADPVWFFFHIRDTAGDRFLWEIRANFEPKEQFPYPRSADSAKGKFTAAKASVDFLLALPPERRAQIRIYWGTFPYAATELMGIDLIRLAILGDPVARAIERLRRHSESPRFAGKDLFDVYDDPRYDRLYNEQTRIFSLTPHDGLKNFRDEVDVDRERLERAKSNLDAIDVVGVSDRYADFLSIVNERFGWVSRAGMPSESEGIAVDDALLDLIREDNAYDLELYEYAKGLVDAATTD